MAGEEVSRLNCPGGLVVRLEFCGCLPGCRLSTAQVSLDWSVVGLTWVFSTSGHLAVIAAGTGKPRGQWPVFVVWLVKAPQGLVRAGEGW